MSPAAEFPPGGPGPGGPGPGGPGPGAAGPAVHIDRLALHVTGLDEAAARTLARLVAEGLTPGMLRSPGHASLDHLRIEVTAGAAERGKPDVLARRIVSELGRVLARGRVPGGPGGVAVP